MAIKKISEIGSTVIRSKALVVKDLPPKKLQKLIVDMTDTDRKSVV